ncbi:MAG: winged helix-turn-helix transcriptional regulator [Candidatus Hodarchaeales archaeon]
MSDLKFDHSQFQYIWCEILEIIPIIQEAVEKGMIKHIEKFNTQPNHEKVERELMKNIFMFLRRKWVLEIIHSLAFHDHLFFNEIIHHLGEISSKTLSNRLKELEEMKIITRNVETDLKPIRVWYSLSDFGLGLYKTFLPFTLYFFRETQVEI